MKFSMTGQEKVTFKYRWLLNRGDCIGRFDRTCRSLTNKLLVDMCTDCKCRCYYDYIVPNITSTEADIFILYEQSSL
jgi:hypothetical protein